MLTEWDKLPDEMKTEDVKKYYDMLASKKGSLLLKRGFDIIAGSVMFIVLSPLLTGVSIWIKMDSEGPVFYRQERVTTGGKKFRIYKFRTMVNDADKKGAHVTCDGDARITKVGRKIRDKRIDEFPQLINVIKGDMSFVGTRPEVSEYVNQYTDEMMATLLMPAGVTSLASIKFKDEDEILSKYVAEGENINDVYVKRVLPEKMKYNLEYIENFSFLGDIKLMLKTVIDV